MHEDTQKRMNELIDLLEDNGFTVTASEFKEYFYGMSDPSEGYDDVEKLSIEVDLTIQDLILDNSAEDDNPYRVK